MRAILDINGKQYEVEEGRYLRVETYPAAENDTLTLGNVRMVVAGDQSVIGAPFIEGATVQAVVRRHARGPKLLVYKMRCKKGYRRKNGHRQGFTELQVSLVDFPGRDKFPEAPKADTTPSKAKLKPVKAEEAPKPAKAPETKAAKPPEPKAAEAKPAKAPESKAAPAPKAKKPDEAKEAKEANQPAPQGAEETLPTAETQPVNTEETTTTGSESAVE